MIFYQILPTTSLTKCMQISLENLYIDIGVTKLLSFSSAEASLCRREAGERQKERARAGDYPDLDGETSPV